MDLLIERIFREEMVGDTSFLGNKGATNTELRETWDLGIKHGIEIGLRRASIEGQTIELNANVKDKRHRDFLIKFYALAEEYECAIQHSHKNGMLIIDRKPPHGKT
jgi:hypothetical protein